MNKKYGSRIYFGIAATFASLFGILTLLLFLIDVRPVGPNGSSLGFATLNDTIFRALGRSEGCYTASNILGAISFLMPLLFGMMGLIQWIKRKKITLIDRDLICLGGIYFLLAFLYLVFEIFVVNFRPVLVDGFLEASYPSSHTMLIIVLLGTAIPQIQMRITKKWVAVILCALTELVIELTIVFRLLSGVHWFTDILAGILLGTALIFFYRGLQKSICKSRLAD